MHLCFFPNNTRYFQFGKIAAVGLVIISAIFVLCVMGLVPVKLGFF